MSISEFVESFIPQRYYSSEEELRKAKVLVTALWIIYAFTINYAVTSYFIDYQPGLIVEGIASFYYLGLIFLFKKIGNIDLISNLTLLSATFCITVVVYYAGGFSAPTLPWLAFPPLVSLMLASKKYAWLWLSIVLMVTITFWVMTLQDYEFPVVYNMQYHEIFKLICAAGLIAIMFLICYVFENAKTSALDKLGDANHLLTREKEKSDNLLSNILPEEIIKELSEKGKITAKQYENVTVFMADIEGFSQIAEQLTPRDLIETLDVYFKEFDEIMGHYDVEKIKTIGDAYLAAAGLPIRSKNHAERIINAAKACQKSVSNINTIRETQGLPVFHFRIGVHTGPLVAGVVGKKKFAYDIWGDTVNIAARMEQNSEPGKINLSQSTYDSIKEKFDCLYRGKIDAKNKGQLDMYYVVQSTASS